MSIPMNLFNIQKNKGSIAASSHIKDGLACTVDPDLVGYLVPGQAVKLVPGATFSSTIVTAADPTDDIYGFVIYSIKGNQFAANSQVDITRAGMIQIMQAAGALDAGVRVGTTATNQKIQSATDMTITPVGLLLDKAINDGDLVRVEILVPDRFTLAMLQALILATDIDS